MAKSEELNLDTAKSDPAKKGKGKLVIMIVAGAVLLSALTVGILYFTGMMGSGDSADEAANEDESKPAKVENKAAFYLDMPPAFVSNFEQKGSGAAYMQIEMQLMSRDAHVLDVAKLHMPLIRHNINMLMSAQNYEEMKTRAGKEKLQETILASVREVVSNASAHGKGTDKEKSKDKEQDQSKGKDKSKSKDAHKDKDKAKDKAKANDSKDEEHGVNVDAVYFTSFVMQ